MQSAPTVETRRVVSPSNGLGELEATDPSSENRGLWRGLSHVGVLSLELDRREVAKRRASSPRVAPTFDVLKGRGPRFGPGWARAPVDPLVHGPVRSQAVRTLPKRFRELAGCLDFAPYSR